MNSDMMRAGELLSSRGYSCVLMREGSTFTSYERGVKPLLKWLDSGFDFSGYFAADKVVGRGAAFLYIHLRVRGVYARVMSLSARDLLWQNGIAVVCDNYTEHIINRTGDGICPFEAIVENITDMDEAKALIYHKARELFGSWEGEAIEEVLPAAAGSLSSILGELLGDKPMEIIPLMEDV